MQSVDGMENTINSAYSSKCDELLIVNNIESSEIEVETAIKIGESEEVAKIADFAKVAEDIKGEDNGIKPSKGGFHSLPCIPERVYDSLPDLLKESCSYFGDVRQKDIFLTGALGVLSGCFPSIGGEYHNSYLYSNLYAFITAPAASGKGALTHTRNFGIKYHKELLLNGTKDIRTLLFIPGNSSSAALQSHLEESRNGIFFETEADTLGNTFKQEWGDFSDLLRKAFHHEPVTYSRKLNNEYIEIEDPKLSVIISGTPSQIQGLIKSSENGLFSRFIFYAFKSEAEWEDVSPKKDGQNIRSHFKDVSERAYEIIKVLKAYESINFHLTPNQWRVLNLASKESLKGVIAEYGEEASGLVKRMGVMWFRLAMILTSIRKYNFIDESHSILCDDIDFNCAKDLIFTYKKHILKIYESLPKQSYNVKNESAKSLFENLPSDQFSRIDAQIIGKKLGYSERSSDGYLKDLCEGKLIKKIRNGVYHKQ